MGCFNATCSLSDLTIHSGQKCLLFPLLPTMFNSDKLGVIKIGPDSMFTSNEGAYMFYVPMSLPIEGEYNDYGSIENIVKNKNTEAIEKFFKMSIEDFVSIITDGRKGMTDSYSDTFQVFSINKKLLDFGKSLNGKFLNSLGFVESSEKNTFTHPNVSGYTVKLIPLKKSKQNHYNKPFAYQIINDKTGQVKKPTDLYDIEKHFLSDFFAVTSYHLNVKPEDQNMAKLLLATSGMFILKEVYDLYTKDNIPCTVGSDKHLESGVLEKMGFKLRCKDKTIDRYQQVYEFPGVTDYVINSDGTWSHIVKTSKDKPNTGQQVGYTFHPYDLIKEWKNLTGIDLPVSEKFLKKSTYDFNFDELVKALTAKSKNENEIEKMLEEGKNRHKKALSSEEELDKSFNDWVKELHKRKKDAEKYKASKEVVKDEEEESEDDLKDILDPRGRYDFEDDDDSNFSMKEIDADLKRIQEENDFFIDESKPIEERKALYRKRLEGFLSEDKKDKALSRWNNPLGHEKLRMKFPIPEYCFRRFEFVPSIYKESIKDKSIKPYFVDFCHFYHAMRRNHRFFSPASYGTQEDNSYSRKILAEKIIEISNERQKEYQENY